MRYVGVALEIVAFLCFSGWMFIHEHPYAGGFALATAMICAYTLGEPKKEKNDEQ